MSAQRVTRSPSSPPRAGLARALAAAPTLLAVVLAIGAPGRGSAQASAASPVAPAPSSHFSPNHLGVGLHYTAGALTLSGNHRAPTGAGASLVLGLRDLLVVGVSGDVGQFSETGYQYQLAHVDASARLVAPPVVGLRRIRPYLGIAITGLTFVEKDVVAPAGLPAVTPGPRFALAPATPMWGAIAGAQDRTATGSGTTAMLGAYVGLTGHLAIEVTYLETHGTFTNANDGGTAYQLVPAPTTATRRLRAGLAIFPFGSR